MVSCTYDPLQDIGARYKNKSFSTTISEHRKTEWKLWLMVHKIVVDEQGIVDKLSNKQEFFIGAQCVNPLGVVRQPCADGPIDKSLDVCCGCGKLIGLEDLKVRVADLAKAIMERIRDPK
jgi:hypothetical protein